MLRSEFGGYGDNLWRFVSAKSLSPRIQMRFIIIFCAGVFVQFSHQIGPTVTAAEDSHKQKIMYSLTDFEKGDVQGFLS